MGIQTLLGFLERQMFVNPVLGTMRRFIVIVAGKLQNSAKRNSASGRNRRRRIRKPNCLPVSAWGEICEPIFRIIPHFR
ncbi:MAG: hypothetical protein LBH00_00910 [Planctomycetaceae bacterium]|jgi:hypothetical protein|nr:hypothetical protein [Planctomycetaceae bacterium]